MENDIDYNLPTVNCLGNYTTHYDAMRRNFQPTRDYATDRLNFIKNGENSIIKGDDYTKLHKKISNNEYIVVVGYNSKYPTYFNISVAEAPEHDEEYDDNEYKLKYKCDAIHCDELGNKLDDYPDIISKLQETYGHPNTMCTIYGMNAQYCIYGCFFDLMHLMDGMWNVPFTMNEWEHKMEKE